MYTLVYQCQNCKTTLKATTIDGRVQPAPEVCRKCLSNEGIKKKRSLGAIFCGLQIVGRGDPKKAAWVVQCLWCKGEPRPISGTNLGNQNSCGCLRTSKLEVNYYLPEPGVVNCTCRECKLTYEYNLSEIESMVTCVNGC